MLIKWAYRSPQIGLTVVSEHVLLLCVLEGTSKIALKHRCSIKISNRIRQVYLSFSLCLILLEILLAKLKLKYYYLQHNQSTCLVI
jgi:hypothetical protein